MAGESGRLSGAGRLRIYALLGLSSVLMFLGFAGFAIWPLAFVGIIPALFVVDPLETRGGFARPAGSAFLLRALFFATLAEAGGFYWLVHTLRTYSGFHPALCLLLGAGFFAYQGLQLVLVLWLWTRARRRGWAATPALVAAYLATEAVFPMLFEHYYGASLHPVPVLMQVADLGGPMLCTALVMGVAGAAYDVVSARVRGVPVPWAWPAAATGFGLFAVAYGSWRLADVDAWAARSPSLTVGVVQANTGRYEKWEEPAHVMGLHVEQTVALARRSRPDLVVWPEAALGFPLPDRLARLSDWAGARALGLTYVDTPLLFGTLRRGALDADGRPLRHNSALLVDGQGEVLGTYDKNLLVPFSEYMPFGNVLPQLRQLSPVTGRLTPGTGVEPLQLGPHRITVLICYEDVVSSFVRRAALEGRPHLLVNLTNDSWFGETQQPWVHLALARFRAVENRRSLVRATLTGVSAIVDPAGRVVASSGVSERATLESRVALLEGGRTLFQAVGPWPGWVALAGIAWMYFGRPRRHVQRPRV